MCRLLAYLGQPLPLAKLLSDSDHSLVVQSYQPREMTSGVVNADGFGVGWYHAHRDTDPFTYKSILPIWNDSNLNSLGRYVESGCVLANVRSATPGLAVDLSNCQPFQWQRLLAIHNGFIQDFRRTLYRPLRDQLADQLYQSIQGTTDSEHLFALFLQIRQTVPHKAIALALQETLYRLTELTQRYDTTLSANLILSDGSQLVASRYADPGPAPSLYWSRQTALFPKGVAIASEPLDQGKWTPIPDQSLVTVGDTLDIHITPL